MKAGSRTHAVRITTETLDLGNLGVGLALALALALGLEPRTWALAGLGRASDTLRGRKDTMAVLEVS